MFCQNDNDFLWFNLSTLVLHSTVQARMLHRTKHLASWKNKNRIEFVS